jgi:hypothetical protein
VRSRRASSGRVQRARIVLLAARGATNAEIARECQCTENTVRKWRARFHGGPRLHTLKDDMRSGRPPTIPMFVRLTVFGGPPFAEGARTERNEEGDPRPFPLSTYARRGGLRQAPRHAAQSPP